MNFDLQTILALGVQALNDNSSQDCQLPFDLGLLEIPCRLKLKGSPQRSGLQGCGDAFGEAIAEILSSIDLPIVGQDGTALYQDTSG